MSLVTKVTELAQAIAADIKALRTADGDLSLLTTTEKTNLVGSINELAAALQTASNTLANIINDAAGSGIVDKTWSASKIINYVQNTKSDILGGIAPTTLDTIFELATELQNAESNVSSIFTALGFRVRVDAVQSFDGTQQTQGRANIGAASAAILTQLLTDIGDTTTDFVTAYEAAKL